MLLEAGSEVGLWRHTGQDDEAAIRSGEANEHPSKLQALQASSGQISFLAKPIREHQEKARMMRQYQ